MPKNSCLKKEVHLKRSFFFKVFSDYFLTKRFVSGSGAVFKSWVNFDEDLIKSLVIFKSTPSTLFLKNFNISSEKMLGLRLTLNFVSVSTVLLHKFVKKSTFAVDPRCFVWGPLKKEGDRRGGL